MKLEIRASTPADAPALASFLAECFGLPRAHPMIDPRQLHWKYWEPSVDWTAPRSVVMTRAGEIVAHAGIVPRRLLHNDSCWRVAHLIDWAARRNAAGAGRALLMHARRTVDAMIAIGGSAETRSLLPVFGFETVATVTVYARALNPWRRVTLAPDRGWRLIPQFFRSAYWALTAHSQVTGDWCVRQVDRTELAGISIPFPRAQQGRSAMERSPALFDYAIRCPITPMSFHTVADGTGHARGYCLLAFAPGQVRLGDCWLNSEDPSDWTSLVGLAARLAQAEGSAAELVAWSSEPRMSASLLANGFHARARAPIQFLGPGGGAAQFESIRIQMLDNDSISNHSGVPEFEA